MLPVITYDQNEQTRDQLFSEISSRKQLNVLTQTSSTHEVLRFATYERSAKLLIVGLNNKSFMEELSLIRSVYANNRDSYIVPIISSLEQMDALLDGSVKLSALLAKPVTSTKMQFTLDHIVLDYAQHHAQDEGDVLTVKTGATVFRIKHEDILFVEAQSKKIDIWTRRECISLYGSMEQIQQQLSNKDFLRCHRSYLVNCKAVKRMESRHMQLILINDVAIPFSRANRSSLRKHFSSDDCAHEEGFND